MANVIPARELNVLHLIHHLAKTPSMQRSRATRSSKPHRARSVIRTASKPVGRELTTLFNSALTKQSSNYGMDPAIPRPMARYWLSLSTAMKASWGTSTLPIAFMRFLPLACFWSSFFLREMSPP